VRPIRVTGRISAEAKVAPIWGGGENTLLLWWGAITAITLTAVASAGAPNPARKCLVCGYLV